MSRPRNLKKKLIHARPIRVSDETYNAILKINPDLGFSTLVRKILEEYLRSKSK